MNAVNEASLTEYNFIAVIDKSGSMTTADMKGRSRWDYMQESCAAFCRDMEKLDSDGIDVVFFSGSSGVVSHPNVTADKVPGLFAESGPRGGTPLAEALAEALKIAGKSNKKAFIVVFTDGTPDDEGAAAKVIRDQSNRQKADEDCTFLFIQVGRDAEATKYLSMLDDGLKGAQFDIVDAMTIDEAEKFQSTVAMIIKAIGD